jgi:AraC family transcriptional regulator
MIRSPVGLGRRLHGPYCFCKPPTGFSTGMPTRAALPVTHGAHQRSTNVTGFRITEAAYPPGMTVAFHEHAYPSFTYVISGAFEESFRHVTHTCVAGTLLSKSAHAGHSNRYGPSGALCLLIEVTDTSALTDAAYQRLFDSVDVHPVGRVVSLARSVRRALVHGERGAPLDLEALLLDLGATIARAPTPAAHGNRGWLQRTRDRLAEEFVSPPSLDELAYDAGVHKVYLCQAFRAAYGCSPGEFIRECRLEHGRHLLATSDTSISAIAALTGYSDQSHFTRHFRQVLGIPPALFRRYASRAH